jgi:hypothetical protein
MEPARHGRDDGSRKRSLLSCEDTTVCEQLPDEDHFSCTNGLVKMRARPLTCARALPGI